MIKNPLRGKTILILNTGYIQKRFIYQRIKKLGLKIVVVNEVKNWANYYVDHWIIADTYRHANVLSAIETFMSENPEVHIDGALTFWEDSIELLAKVCAKFGFTGNSLEAAKNTRSKYLMQEVMNNAGLPAIKEHLLAHEEDLTVAIGKIGFPAIIKPVGGSLSQFVVRVNNVDEAKNAYVYIRKNCTPEFDPIYIYNEGKFVYQSYIDGPEFSAECYIQHGIPHVVGIHEKTAMSLPFFMETGDYLPPRIDEEDIDSIEEAVESALIVLGVRNSLAHAELKLTEEGVKIIEIASRMGGDYTYRAVKEVHDFDLIQAACYIALGVHVHNTVKKPDSCIVGKFFIPEDSGVITKLRGFEGLKSNPSVVDFLVSKQVGDKILIPPDGYDYIGWVLVKGDTYADADRAIEEVEKVIDIEVTPFKATSTLGKTQRKNKFSSALILGKRDDSGKIERLRRLDVANIRKLKIGIACNVYESEKGSDSEVEKDLMGVGKNIELSLQERGYVTEFLDFNKLSPTLSHLTRSDIDLVFNVCERINNSSLLEPHAASIFDIMRIPYTGSNPLTLALCIDKIKVKKLLNFHNIPTPRWDYAYTLDDEINEDLRYPLIVKPANSDNSIGITNDSVVTNKKDLLEQMDRVINGLHNPALVEEYIEGDEYDVSIIGSQDDDLRVLPLSRSVFTKMPVGMWHVYAYDAKWNRAASEYSKIIIQKPPKSVSQKLQTVISEIALDTYNILNCHDYGRVEVRVDNAGNPYVLELNPNPSIDIGDCVPKVAEIEGFNYGDFLEEIIRLTVKRYKNKPPYYHLQNSLI
ncbi:hypothetical protein COU88_00065 [Candidatus Roizmanbacteria bacterium CG10_big_fil_rev_8_21_14_0_10_39_6]|uniref:ATP-grasp domain-containing protein n=1 Tax=Candidatus Roizmanbacteria bacterium CG10_big_fil_rev_8_21_14_0_10_39_6 TaxID=1974853 RepID=A0A2M8KTZ4_9BACT|nr:MAG: hypothetical protein COU88_00065 [Candidatus Roizmanbacteria bacterium CG10_big_fil_rev_8_21_14_0_10_39_6]